MTFAVEAISFVQVEFASFVRSAVLKGSYRTIKVGAQQSCARRFAFEGVGGVLKTDDHSVMTPVRYQLFSFV